MSRPLAAWIWVLVLLAAGPALALAQSREPTGPARSPGAVADVPPDHWAYQAVMTLVQRGYLALEPGNRFDGTRPVDRFTLASVVARLLQDLQRGQVQLAGEDLQLVRQLTGEFREELARWQDQRGQVNQRLDAQAQEVERIDLKLTDLLNAWDSQAAQLEERLQRLNESVLGLGAAVSSLQQRLDQTDRAVREGSIGLQSMRQTVDLLNRQAGSIQDEFNTLRQQLVALDQQVGGRVPQLASEVGSLRRQATELESRVGRLEREGQAMARTAAAAELRDLVGRLGMEASSEIELRREVGRLREQNRTLTYAAVAGVVLGLIGLLVH